LKQSEFTLRQANRGKPIRQGLIGDSGITDKALARSGQLQERILMRRSATVTDARRIAMRLLLVCAVAIDGILENMGRMRSLAAEAHREITRRYNEIMLDLHERHTTAGAVQRLFAMRKGARGQRRQAGAGI
jgi:hypothetical protein